MADPWLDANDALFSGKAPTAPPAPPIGEPTGPAATDYGNLFNKYGSENLVDPLLLQAQAIVESKMNPKARSQMIQFGPDKGGYSEGLMQISPSMRKAFKITDSFNPDQSVSAGAKILRQNLDQKNGDLNWALSAYNGGTDESKWGPDAKSYPDKVLAEYKKLGGDPTQAAWMMHNDAQFQRKPGEGVSLIPHQTFTPAEVHAPTQPVWDGWRNYADATLEGLGGKLSAAANAAKETYGDIQHGTPVGDAVTQRFPFYYDQAKEVYKGAKDTFHRQEPSTALGTELLGSIPTTAAVLSLGGAALEAGGARLGTAFPRLAPAIQGTTNFLGGTAGRDINGIRGFLARRASQTTSGALQGVASAGLESGLHDQPLPGQLEAGGAVGGVIGAAASPVVNALLSPFEAKVEPGVARMARRAGDLGLDLRGGQLTTNGFVRGMDRTLASHHNDTQLSQFTQGVSRTFGEDTDRISHATMNSADDRIGDTLSNVAKNTQIVPDQKFWDDLTDLEAKYRADLPATSPEAANIRKKFDMIMNEANAGPISGETYQALTRRKSPLGRLIASPNANESYYGIGLRTILDDALERHSPADMIDELRLARKQWRNMMTVKDVVEQAQPSGLLDPQSISNAVTKGGFKDTEDLRTLGDAGKFLSRATAQGSALGKHGGKGLAGLAGLGELALGYTHGAVPALLGGLGLALSYGGSKLTGHLLESKGYRNLLLDQAQRGQRGIGRPNVLIPTFTDLYNQ